MRLLSFALLMTFLSVGQYIYVVFFTFQTKISKMNKRKITLIKDSLQEGYCYSKAFPYSEIKLFPDLITRASSPVARGPHHRITRAKFRTLE